MLRSLLTVLTRQRCPMIPKIKSISFDVSWVFSVFKFICFILYYLLKRLGFDVNAFIMITAHREQAMRPNRLTMLIDASMLCLAS